MAARARASRVSRSLAENFFGRIDKVVPLLLPEIPDENAAADGVRTKPGKGKEKMYVQIK